MRLIKTERSEYWVNDKNQRHGEYKGWWDDGHGKLSTHCFYFNGKEHGECKWWYDNGKLVSHDYYHRGKKVRDLLKEPVTEEDKFMLTLEHGGKWLCN